MKDFLCRAIWVFLLEGGTIVALFEVGKLDADWSLKMTGKGRLLLMVLCMLQSADIAGHGEWSRSSVCLLAVLAGCLLTACVMDLWEKQIYRYVWWAGGGAACSLFLCSVSFSTDPVGSLLSFGLFLLLQYGVFEKLYGRADCTAFCVCAAVFPFFGGGFQEYVLHMAIAFSMLALIQICKGNVASDGNLVKPVAFVPYIAAAFWFWVDFMG